MTTPHWIASVLNGLSEERFYGTLTLKFRDGQLVLIEKTQTILPPESQNAKNAKEVTHA